MYYNGDSQNTTDFMITLDNAETLNGYNQVIGELVQGDEVLEELEKSLSRSGPIKDDITIDDCGLH